MTDKRNLRDILKLIKKKLRFLISKIIRREPITVSIPNRIPAPLRESNQYGIYVRKNPYPLDSIIQDFQSKPFVTKNTKTIVMGSCFAQHINRWLKTNGYGCLEHVWGVIYTPKSISQIIQYSFERNSWDPAEPFWIMEGKYYFPYLKADDHKGPKYLGEDESSALQAIEDHFKQSAELLKEAELVIWNIGITELWRNKEDQLSFYALPFPQLFNQDRHEFYNLNYDDVLNILDYSITTLKEFNPQVKIIFSIEPVPLSFSFQQHMGPYVATQYAKSVTTAAAMALVETHEDVFYLPAYEIIRNDHKKYYGPDGRHINEDGLDAIMKAYEKLYVQEGQP